MKILILSDEVWNDQLNGNSVLYSWFDGMDAEFANIYLSSGIPINNCCSHYFQVTDIMMAKSIYSKNKAGYDFFCNCSSKTFASSDLCVEKTNYKLYNFLKSISGSSLRFFRELIWEFGRYDLKKLKRFVVDFHPDIIFTERKATLKMLRLEKIIYQMTKCPMVAFTGDDECSYKQIEISPFFWINRFMIRRKLFDMADCYEFYYTLSDEQKKYYQEKFKCHVKILRKCSNISKIFKSHHLSQEPIKIIYAGKLYCNRWKVLAEVVNAIRGINVNGQRILLKIFTQDVLTPEQEMLFNDGKNSQYMGSTSQEDLIKQYNYADIALHVESQDIKNRYRTRLSFSTKIVDCLASGCAVMAICWKHHSGYVYLKNEEAAICIDSIKNIKQTLENIVNNKIIVEKYAEKAWQCAKRNHDKDIVQKQLKSDLASLIRKGRRRT